MKCKIGKGKKLLKTMTEKYYKLKQHTINIHYVNHVLLNAAVRILVYTFCHSKCKVAEGIYIVSQKIIKFQETLPVVFTSLFIVCFPFWSKAILDGYTSCACTVTLSFGGPVSNLDTKSPSLPILRYSTNHILHN